jgi:hypothetical protein
LSPDSSAPYASPLAADSRRHDDLDALVTTWASRIAASDESLLDAADAERLGALVYHVFHRHGWPETVSELERRELRKVYYLSAGHNVELLGAFSEVATALHAHGLDCVAFKGADLVRRLYPNVAVRPMGDVDVYVAPSDADRAEKILAGIGYRPWCPDMTPGLSRRIRHARLYVGGPDDAMSVDLHWSLVGNVNDARAPDLDWLRRSILGDGPEPWMHFSDSAHLLYLSAHMKLQHYDEEIPLMWLIDFHLLATHGDIVWDEFFADAARLGWSGAVSAAAFDARERLGVTLPPELAEVAAAPTTTLHRSGSRNEPLRVWNELRTLRWSGRIALTRAYVLPSVAYVRFRYPGQSWPVGYARRWATLLTKTGRLVFHALKRRPGPRPLLTSRETC